MKCGGCGNPNAHRTLSGAGWEVCDDCGNLSGSIIPDVYWDGKPEYGLADGPDGKPMTFGSKREKAVYLKSRGLREAGDRLRGSFSSPVGETKEERRRRNRHEFQMARKKALEMGKDVRHQMVLKARRDYERAVSLQK